MQRAAAMKTALPRRAVLASPGENSAPASTRPERALILILPTLAALGPLLPFLGSVFAFRAAALLFFFVVFFRRRPQRSSSVLRTATWALLIIGALAAFVLSLAHGIDTYAASELASCFFGAILLIAVLLARLDRKFIIALFLGWAASIIVTGALAAYEMQTGWRASNYFANREAESVLTDPGLASTFGNPNDFAYFLLIAFLILVAGFAVVRKRLVGLLIVAFLVGIAVLIQKTESTLGLVALAIIVLSLILARFPHAVILVAPVIAAGALLVANSPGGIAGILGVDRSQVSWFDEGQTGAIRFNLLGNGMNFALESGFLGLGPGGYEPRTAEGHPYDLATKGILSPHSAALEILSQYGIFVFAATVVVVFHIARAGWRSYRDKSFGRGRQVAGLALVLFAVLSPLMTMMASASLEPSYTWMAFASMLVLAMWMTNARTEQPHEAADADEADVRESTDRRPLPRGLRQPAAPGK